MKFCDNISLNYLRMSNICAKFAEKVETGFVFSNSSPLQHSPLLPSPLQNSPPQSKKCRFWDIVGKYGCAKEITGDTIIRRACFSCRTATDTDKHSGYVILTAGRHWLWSSGSFVMSRNTYLVCVVRFMYCTRLFKTTVWVQFSSGNSAPNSGNNHHLTIPFEGVTHSFNIQGASVRIRTSIETITADMATDSLKRTRLSCWCL